MKKFSIVVGKATCPRDKVTLLLGRIEGEIMADGSRRNNVMIVERCGFCQYPSTKEFISPEKATSLIARIENHIRPPLEEKSYPQDVNSSNFLQQIEEEAKAAIKRGWDASKVGWRREALKILLTTALSQELFTVNDFRQRIKDSGIVTHDNRAMGGLMVTARNWGWIKPSGDEITSKVGHKSKLQVWRSNIVQGASAREEREAAQQALFSKV